MSDATRVATEPAEDDHPGIPEAPEAEEEDRAEPTWGAGVSAEGDGGAAGTTAAWRGHLDLDKIEQGINWRRGPGR